MSLAFVWCFQTVFILLPNSLVPACLKLGLVPRSVSAKYAMGEQVGINLSIPGTEGLFQSTSKRADNMLLALKTAAELSKCAHTGSLLSAALSHPELLGWEQWGHQPLWIPCYLSELPRPP